MPGELRSWRVWVAGVAVLICSPGAMADRQDVSACVEPVAYWPLDPRLVGADANGVAALGTYERVSPDGRFVLRSYSGAQVGKVSLMELPLTPAAAVKVYRTPFSNEAFPVQGSWRYLVDVTGEHYRLSDIITQQTAARPLFKAGMTGFYAGASELVTDASGAVYASEGSPPIYIRSLSWPQNADPDGQGVGPLQVETIEVQDDGRTARVRQSSGPRFICSGAGSGDGGVYALPMISVDGTEFSAIPQTPRQGSPSMRVYGLSKEALSRQHPCDKRADLGQSPSKAVFGSAAAGQQAWLTYSDIGNVYVYDRDLRQSFRLDHAKHKVLASAFPGLTRDGRVIYGASWRDCPDTKSCGEQAGYVVVDPYQSAAYRQYWKNLGQTPPKTCITQNEVRTERARLADFHSLPLQD